MSQIYSGRDGIVSARRPATPPPGRLETALLRLLARRATVTESVPLGERFRQITIAGLALRGQPWSPGQKIQLQFGRWTQRSYTPVSWDSERGVARIIAYLPALGPGSQWAATVQPGEECALYGPRRSLDPLRTKAPVVLFGDETALGLLQALTLATGTLDPLHAVLEAHSAPALQHAADALGLRSVTIIQRTPDDSHRSAVEQALLTPLRHFPSRHCVLAGRAQSIQHAARLLRHQRVPSSQISTRAYWSVGKEGLE